MLKKMNLGLYLISCAKTNSRGHKDLNIKNKTSKYFEGEYFFSHWDREGFLKHNPKSANYLKKYL